MILSAHASPQPKQHVDRFSRLCTDDSGVSLQFTMVCLFPPQNCPSHVGIWTSCNMWFIGPPDSGMQMVTWSSQPFLQGSLVWHSDRATERLTDRPSYSVWSGIIMRKYVGYSKATQSFHVSTNNFATINVAICTFKTFNKISRFNSYILFGSVHCSQQSSSRNIYVVPVYHLNIGIQGPININISLQKICNYYDYSTNY